VSGAIIGPIPTLWDGNGAAAALHGADDLLAETHPTHVQIHTWKPDDSVVNKVRLLTGNASLILGVGIDGVAREVVSGRRTVKWGVDTLVSLAKRAHGIGAIAICWNAESSWKTPPNTEQRKLLGELIKTALAQVVLLFPDLEQWHTSFDHPTYFPDYPWSFWIGSDSPVIVSMPQVYAAPLGDVMAHRGALERREATSLASYKVAIEKNWIDKDIPDGQPGDETDVDFRPYLQLHSVPTVDTVAVAVQSPFVGGWAIHANADRAGRNALRAMCALQREGFWLPGIEVYRGMQVASAVRAFQRKIGVDPDGDFGPKTAAAARIKWE
jgi:hypothetical protein